MTNRYPGKDLYFAVDDTGGTQRVLTGVTSVTGLPGQVEHYEAAAVGESGHKHVAGLENVRVTVEGWYDDTGTTGSKQVLSALAGARSEDFLATLTFGPKGGVAGNEKISGEAKLENLEYPAALGDLVKFRAEFLIQGVVTFATFS